MEKKITDIILAVKEIFRACFHLKRRKQKGNQFLEYFLSRTEDMPIQTKHVKQIYIRTSIFP